MAMLIVFNATPYLVTESALAIAAVEGCVLNIIYIRAYANLRFRNTIWAIRLCLSIATMSTVCIGVLVLIVTNGRFGGDLLSIWVSFI
jgi:hypothetical protein